MQQPQKALRVVFRSQFFLTSEFKENLQNITVRMRCKGLDDSFLLLLFLFARLTFNFHLNEIWKQNALTLMNNENDVN